MKKSLILVAVLIGVFLAGYAITAKAVEWTNTSVLNAQLSDTPLQPAGPVQTTETVQSTAKVQVTDYSPQETLNGGLLQPAGHVWLQQ